MMVSPPRTRSPTATRTSVPRGAIRSVRDPKRISPKRCPASSLSPRSHPAHDPPGQHAGDLAHRHAP